jgi:hypothetical protein
MRVMKWLTIVIVLPIGFFTILAIPMHLSIANSEIRVGHYASLRTESFPYSQAKKAIMVHGSRDRNGVFTARQDLFLDFADSRRLDVNAAGDGGSHISDGVVQLLLSKTGLNPEDADTASDLPPFP